MIHISFSREKEMELCDDILNIIASYLNVYDRLPLLSITKRQTDKRRYVVKRIMKIYKVKSDIMYQYMKNKTHICELLPEPIYLKEYVETTSEIEQSNDIIEVYKDNTLTRKCKFKYTPQPLKFYSVEKLILLERHDVYLNDHSWNFDQLERIALLCIDILPESRILKNSRLFLSSNIELLKKLTYIVHPKHMYNYDSFHKLIKHDLFYDEEYQTKMKQKWGDEWTKAVMKFKNTMNR